MSRVVVIGGGGFLGRCFHQLAQKDLNLLICDAPERIHDMSGACHPFSFAEDSPETLPIQRGDIALLLSWRGYPEDHEQKPQHYKETNLSTTYHLMEHLISKGIKELHFASTGGAMYKATGLHPVDESFPPAPPGVYGTTKREAEQLIQDLCTPSKVRYRIYRIGNAFGVGQIQQELSVGLIAKAILAARQCTPLMLWGGNQVAKDYIHATDIARAWLAAIQHPAMADGVYHIGRGESYMGIDIVNLVAATMRREIEVTIGAPRTYDAISVCLDTQKLQNATGWRPHLTLQDGIEQVLQSM